jgi:hypothetical protein
MITSQIGSIKSPKSFTTYCPIVRSPVRVLDSGRRTKDCGNELRSLPRIENSYGISKAQDRRAHEC